MLTNKEIHMKDTEVLGQMIMGC